VIDITTHAHLKARGEAPLQHSSADMTGTGDKARIPVAMFRALGNTEFGQACGAYDE